MSTTRQREILRLGQAALEQPATSRAAFLAEACGGDETLRRDVESLLAQESAADSFIETPALDMALDDGEPAPRLTTGQRLGTYQVLAWLGAGGMGEVYRARDTELGREVALKVLPPMLLADPERLARFEREARVLAALNHPNVGAIYGLAHQGGVRALVLELVDGETLAERLERDGQVGLPITVALPIARQIASALEAAHEKGIIHRDLKPANVKVTPTGVVKVLDFGLAKLATSHATQGAGTANPSQSPTITVGGTRDGLLLGTARYMSPEQARGQPVDKRTDIWAFGCVLYEMLTGQPAFPGATITDTLAAVVDRDPEWTRLPAALQRNVRTLLRRCLAKEISQRLHDIADARLDIDDAGRAVEATPVYVDPKTRRYAWIGWSAAALFLLTTLGAAAVAYLSRPAPDTHVYRNTFVPPATLVNLAGGRLAVSPDGRRLAFTAPGPDGRVLLWVRALDGLAAQTLAGTEDAAAPFWSPDSRFLAFEAGGKLKKIDASGGQVLTVSDTAAPGYSWNRDGVILFSRTLSLAGSSPIFRVAASGGPASAVMPLHDGEIFQVFAMFLPDGRHFLYSSGTATYVGSLDSGERTRLLDGFTNAQYAQGHLLFVRGATLWAQPFDSTRLTLTGQPVPLAEHLLTAAEAGAFSVSETGVLVYQARASDDEESRLVWFDRAGHEIGVLGDRAAYGFSGATVSLSPDGHHAAVNVRDVATRGPTGLIDIWIFDVERGLRTRFTFARAVTGSGVQGGGGGPIWSPDGSRVVFTSNLKGHMDLYQKSASGGGTEELLLADSVEKVPTSWSPDGRFILYSSFQQGGGGSTPNDLWVLPLFGDRKPYPFLQSPFDENWAQFSPDGRWVAYESDESGRREVYVTPFPGHGEKWQVSTAGGVDPRWRHDGRAIFFLSGATTPQAPRAANKLMAAAVRADGSRFEVAAVQALFDVRTPAYGERVYDVSADGRFLIDTVEELTPITIVVNWPALLRK